jgi:dTDP-4-amino-4,6-dideoxygalactose transaminase
VEFGVNSRLDEMQAAILRARLKFLPAWTTKRRELAAQYREALVSSPVIVPPELDAGHVYHLFPVRTPHRDAMQAHLREQGIETLIHFPVPIPKQPAMDDMPPSSCPIADRVCDEVFSLPLHPGLAAGDVDRVAASVHEFRATAAGR